MRAHSLLAARLFTCALLAVSIFACSSNPDAGLFRASGSLGGAAPAGAGSTGTSGAANGQSGNGGDGSAGPASTAGNTSAGSGGTSGDLGSGGVATSSGAGGQSPPGGGAGSSGAPPAGGEGGGGQIGSGECGAHGLAATYFSGTQHCYLVVHELATYADAKAHCATLGAHLVTLANQAEDAFAWSISPAEHWIGSTDGKGPKEPDPGTYTWLTGEPFEYTNWSSAQPNASKTDCGDSNGGGSCYEHCAFQWTGGEHDGQWNDRYCMHTIQAVCEWDDASGGN